MDWKVYEVSFDEKAKSNSDKIKITLVDDVVKKAYETTDFTFDLGWFSNIEVNKNYVKFPTLDGYWQLEWEFKLNKESKNKVEFHLTWLFKSLYQNLWFDDIIFTGTPVEKKTINKNALSFIQGKFVQFSLVLASLQSMLWNKDKNNWNKKSDNALVDDYYKQLWKSVHIEGKKVNVDLNNLSLIEKINGNKVDYGNVITTWKETGTRHANFKLLNDRVWIFAWWCHSLKWLEKYNLSINEKSKNAIF